MDTCFFCHQAIENEDEYILIGLVQDQVAELVPAHQDCAPPVLSGDAAGRYRKGANRIRD